MTRNQVDRVFDYDMLMKDAGLVAADAAALVDGVAKVIDLGGASRIDGAVIIDITVMDVASTDELYDIIVQGSASSTFASGVHNLSSLTVGAEAAHATRGDDADLDLIGHYELPFTNEVNGTSYQYLRLWTVVTGASTGINYIAHLAKKA